MPENEIREGQTGEREQHAQAGVKTQVLVDANVVLRVAAEIVARQKVGKVCDENVGTAHHTEVHMLQHNRQQTRLTSS